MDKISALFKGLNLHNSSHKNDQPVQQSRHKSSDRPPDHGRDHEKEVEALISMLATGLMSYALQQYAKSSHNANRKRGGGIKGADVDFVVLEQIGQKILEKLISAISERAKSSKEKPKLVTQPERGDTEKGKRRQHGDEEEQRRQKHHRRHRKEPEYSSSEEGHRQQRHHRRHRKEPEYSSLEEEDDQERRRSSKPRQVQRRHQRRATAGRHKTSPSSPQRRRESHEDKENLAPKESPISNLDALRTKLEDLSTRLINLSSRSAGGEKNDHHPECEFYDKFLDSAGPVQDLIGDVLGQIRGIEEEDRTRSRRRRRQGTDHRS